MRLGEGRGGDAMTWSRAVVLMALGVTMMGASGCARSSASLDGTGGTAGAAAKASTAKQPVEGSHADRTYVDPGARLAQYVAVYIAPPTMDTTADRDEKVNDFLAQMEATIRSSSESALRSTGRFGVVTTNEQEAKARGKYLVCRNDALVHFGSTVARVLIGMGAGRSKLLVVVSLEDPVTRDVLLKYTGWGGAVLGYGFQILGKMQTDAMAIESYAGGLIQRMPN
jgi:hypothetical protein